MSDEIKIKWPSISHRYPDGQPIKSVYEIKHVGEKALAEFIKDYPTRYTLISRSCHCGEHGKYIPENYFDNPQPIGYSAPNHETYPNGKPRRSGGIEYFSGPVFATKETRQVSTYGFPPKTALARIIIVIDVRTNLWLSKSVTRWIA